MTINVCDTADRGPHCGFLVFWLQNATELIAFHLSGFDYVFNYDVPYMRERTSVRTEHIFVILSCMRIKGEVSRE